MNKLNVIELFSGIGAQHKALSMIKKEYGYDFEVVATSEWSIKSILAYYKIHYSGEDIFKNKTKEWIVNEFKKLNHTFSNDGETPMKNETLYKKDRDFLSILLSATKTLNNLGSILEIKGSDVQKLNPNLITYSFPCQDLSTGAQFTKSKNGLNGNRSGLLYQVERILDEMDKENLPEFLLLENVQQLIVNPVFKKGYDEWESKLETLGYKTKVYLLNAKDFGVPQTRKRVFALSTKINTTFKTELELIEEYKKNFSSHSKTLENVIEMKRFPLEQVEAMVKPTRSRETMRTKVPKLLETRFTFTNTLTKKHDRTPCPGTINMSGYDEILKLVEKHRTDFIGYNYYYRFLTARESFRLMGFEDVDYEKAKTLGYGIRSYYEMTGNSIVVNNLLPIFMEVFKIWKQSN